MGSYIRVPYSKCVQGAVHYKESFEPISEEIGWSSIFDLPEAAIEARGQKWTKNFVGGNNIVKIFLQTDFQKDWAKDKEMTGIFHFFSFVLRKHETRPLCKNFQFYMLKCAMNQRIIFQGGCILKKGNIINSSSCLVALLLKVVLFSTTCEVRN